MTIRYQDAWPWSPVEAMASAATIAFVSPKGGPSVVVNYLGGTGAGQGASHWKPTRWSKRSALQAARQSQAMTALRTREGAPAIIKTAMTPYGQVDIVINNAGFLSNTASRT